MRDARTRRRLAVTVVAVAGAGATVGFGLAGDLAGQATQAIGDADPRWLAVAAGTTAVGYAVAGQAVRGASGGRLGRVGALLLPYASASVNRALPAGAGGVAVTTRVLTARGLSLPAAMGVGVAAAFASGLVGVALFAVGALCTATGLVRLPGMQLQMPHVPVLAPVFVAAAVTGLAATGWLLRRRLRHWRARAARWTTQLPSRAVLARFTALEVINRLAQIATLVACTSAVGEPLEIGPVVVVLAASSLVSGLVPIAGGGGSVEVALTLGLHAAGMSYPAAAAATLLVRLIGYWAPALVGLPCLTALLATGRRGPVDPAEPAAPAEAGAPVVIEPGPHPRRALICAVLACVSAVSAALYD